MKRVLKYLMLMFVILLSSITPINNVVLAEEKGELEFNSPQDPMFNGGKYGDYKDKDVYYTLDIVTPTEIEEKGFLDKMWDTLSLKFIGDSFSNGFHYAVFYGSLFFFHFNLFMTNVMLSVLNFAYDSNMINSLIGEVENVVTSMSGISESGFGSSGLFGGFLGIVSVLIGIYTLYQFIIKKATISAFSGFLKSIVALTVALLFFGNYSTIIKGVNDVSVEASGMILSGKAGTVVDKNSGNINNKTIKEDMNDNLFNTFVHKPYLMLQYGTTEESDIGSKRVSELLTKKTGSESRQEVALKEVTEKGNETLTYSRIMDRLNFTGVLMVANAINSLPVYLLSLSLVIFQFWFLIIAMVAPFALLWAALPNQFGVLKRYFFELSIPLVLKMAVSFLALLIFGMSEVIYSLSSLAGGAEGYLISSLIQAILLFTLFLLRKRIFSIFSVGSDLISNVRSEMSGTFVSPFKKLVGGAATVGGAVVGGAMAGPQGAVVGANMGSSVGNLATGDSGASEMARTAAMSMYTAQKLNKTKGANLELSDTNGNNMNASSQDVINRPSEDENIVNLNKNNSEESEHPNSDESNTNENWNSLLEAVQDQEKDNDNQVDNDFMNHGQEYSLEGNNEVIASSIEDAQQMNGSEDSPVHGQEYSLEGNNEVIASSIEDAQQMNRSEDSLASAQGYNLEGNNEVLAASMDSAQSNINNDDIPKGNQNHTLESQMPSNSNSLNNEVTKDQANNETSSNQHLNEVNTSNKPSTNDINNNIDNNNIRGQSNQQNFKLDNGYSQNNNPTLQETNQMASNNSNTTSEGKENNTIEHRSEVNPRSFNNINNNNNINNDINTHRDYTLESTNNQIN
ncbi:CD3337/EF1877 family mobilome membrane protein [Cytobacillus horneckiae]|uniref:Uncharacterized protein n=2 Tax=Cytobacillus horneckiae TaxID=549687 RepID=A0A2N0ZB00_9BACI|nr:hypothetical protein [Cytobacillus horneckiae]PKG26691.1 hypothetical protein CWS20_22860 [Cytobacillus horneckiae]